MHRLLLTFALFVTVIGGGSAAAAAGSEGAEDVIMITGISPETLASGEEVEVEVRVAYVLHSRDAGAIRLTANLLAPNADRSFASVAVTKGTGEITIRGRIVPRYWSSSVSFGVNAALVVAEGDALQTRALSVDRANFQVNPAPDGQNAGPWPAVPATYVDGATIVSISPEAFEEGVDQEIVVKVKYELLSREEGELSLSASYGSLAARRTIGSTRVKIGQGVAEIRAILLPKKTAGLPVARLLVTLDEFPRSRPSAALAWDEATITVK